MFTVSLVVVQNKLKARKHFMKSLNSETVKGLFNFVSPMKMVEDECDTW